jgi:hypothetical protein
LRVLSGAEDKPTASGWFRPLKELRVATVNARAETVETNSSATRYPTVGSKNSICPDLPPKYDPAGVGTHQSDDETNDPVIADHLNFYKVEKWTKDGSNVDHMLYAGSNLDKAREVFAAAIKHRPRIRLTIRQRTQVLEQWPVSAP